jgi:hypothetical protein
MHKFFSVAAVAAFTMLLASCGGDSFMGKGTTPGGGATGGTLATLSVASNLTTIPSDGSATANITVIAKDANAAVISGAVVAITASVGTLTVTQATTDTNGVAKATLVAGSAAIGSTITITATSGSITGQTTVAVGIASSSTVSMQTDMPQIASNNSQTATITALIRDANNNFVKGVPVTFTSDSGGLTVTQSTTDATGAAIAKLSTPNDPSNRNITVSATAGTSTGKLVIAVAGTNLSVSGPTSLVLGSSGTFNVSLTDSAGTGISAASVAVASTAGTPSAPSVTTDSSGHATFTLMAATSGNQAVSVTGVGITASQPVTVSGESFSFTTPAAPVAPLTSTAVNIGTAQTLIVHWTSNGAPLPAGQTVNFAASRGTLSAASAVTDAGGNAQVTIQSAQSGPSVISATATDSTVSPAVSVQTQANLDFLATTPTAVNVQPSPATIPASGQSTISAIVRDAANNLVENKVVNFALTDVTGGSITVASAVTDVQGRAQTVYKASTVPSGSGGVTITATVQGTAVTDSAILTVGGQTVFLSLGTGNKVTINSNDTQFIMPWSVSAVDSAGNPVSGIAITLTLHSKYYNKGTWQLVSGAWGWAPVGVAGGSPPDGVTIAAPGCANEDLNLNGVLDPTDGDASGTGNNNGKLEPGDIALASPGSVTTAAVTSSTSTQGTALFTVNYPQDHAMWVTSTLTATATAQGTETSVSSTFQLPMAADHISDAKVSPPGIRSPYGIANSCTNPN